MKIKILIVVLILLNTVVISGQREIRVRLGEGVALIPVAVPVFSWSHGSEINTVFIKQLRSVFLNDLKYSRVFKSVSSEYFRYIKKFDPEQILFNDWASIQTKILVVGKLEIIAAKKLVLQIKVYDVESERLIFGKIYTGHEKVIRVMAHRAADEMMKRFGEKPFFNSKVAFVSRRNGNSEIYIMDYDGKNQTRITVNRNVDYLPSWSADGKRLIYTTYRKSKCDLYNFNIYTGKLSVFSTGGTNYSADWSREKDEVVYTSTKRANNAEIYIRNMNTSKDKRITFNRWIDTSPCFSPNGNEIVFVSNRTGNPHLYIMNSDGTNVRKISYGGVHYDAPDWSPDGSRIVYVSRVNRKYDLFVLYLKDNSIVKLTENAGFNEMPTWSPDGRHVIFQSNRSGSLQLYSVDYDGQNLKQLTFKGNNEIPAWQK